MSAMGGQSATWQPRSAMSGLPPKADMRADIAEYRLRDGSDIRPPHSITSSGGRAASAAP